VTLLVTFIIIYVINLYQKQLVQLANEDPLTGLSNRRKFNDTLEKLIKMYHKGVNHIVLILIDVDDFKEVNDVFGHVVGDQTLVRIAEILKTQMRQTDLIARWGGEEFAILLSGVDKEKAVEIAQKFLSAVKDDTVIQTLLQKPLTISIGLGELSSVESQDGLVQKVDKALYAAKNNGKNQLIFV